MCNHLSEKQRSRRGTAVVEVGLLLPLFLLVVLAIMDVSRLYWTRNVVGGAAYEGVRMAILEEATDSQVQAVVIDELASGGLSQSPVTTVGPRVSRQPVSVTVSVPFSFIILGRLIPELDENRQVTVTAMLTYEG